MGLVDAFDATWSAALATFGDGSPGDGREFEESSRRLGDMVEVVSSARPRASWAGASADAYVAANDAHGAVIGKLASLDSQLATEVSRSAAVVSDGRRDLAAVRAAVHAVAASLPQNARGDQLLMPTVRRGLDDVVDVIRRTHGDAGVIADRIRDLGARYRALGDEVPRS